MRVSTRTRSQVKVPVQKLRPVPVQACWASLPVLAWDGFCCFAVGFRVFGFSEEVEGHVGWRFRVCRFRRLCFLNMFRLYRSTDFVQVLVTLACGGVQWHRGL